MKRRFDDSQNELRKLPELEAICEQLHVKIILFSAKAFNILEMLKRQNVVTNNLKTT